MHEIERKFLVTKPLLEIVAGAKGKRVEQCYLPKTGDWTVRVRRTQAAGMTFCTKTMKQRISDRKCVELETPVSEMYFCQVRTMCGAVLEKTRFAVLHAGHLWEIDHFHQSEFKGLVIAEIELKSEDEDFDIPDWLGEEVTADKQYKNVRMAKRLIMGMPND